MPPLKEQLSSAIDLDLELPNMPVDVHKSDVFKYKIQRKESVRIHKKFKVVVVGDSQTGKSQLIETYKEEEDEEANFDLEL